MNILFVTSSAYLPQLTGGAESSTHDLCRALIRRNISPHVLSSLRPNGSLYWTNRIRSKLLMTKAPTDRILGYPTHRCWDPVSAIPEVIGRVQPTFALVKAGNSVALVDQLISNNIKAAVYLREVCFNRHGGMFKYHDNLRFIANSQFTADRFYQHSGIRAKVILPLVDPLKYKVESSRQHAVLINPIALKGVDIVIEIARMNPDIPFLFVENWSPTEKEREALRVKIGGATNITVISPQADMKTVYGTAKVVLIPSIVEEGWGRVATESQLNGIPTLASTHGALPESVGSGGIIICPEANIEDWSSALRNIWFDKETYQRLSNESIKRSNRVELTEDHIINEILNVFEE